ncbi:MAG: DUF935 domain-containing protein [Melioribacteraceae bacterium]|nr:DUF935 domain-containing protein [Melioribacteraceae bacterium]MCF8414549.1 DUF935 domain-containing protein [Melioribacteraceae bacterium]
MAKGIFVNERQFKTLDALALEKEIASRSNATGFLSWFSELPDPDPVLRKLGQSVSVYKDLFSDDQVGSTTIRLKNEVKKKEWRIKPAEGMDKNSKGIKICKDVLSSLEDNGCAVKDLISQSTTPHFWGMSTFEANWDTSKPIWLPQKLQLKPIDWFFYDGENDLRFRAFSHIEGLPITGYEAPKHYKYQFFVLRNEPTYENPYGDKALSRCFWPVAFKRGVLKYGMIFIERYGIPHLEIKHPPGDDEDTVQKLVDTASLMIQDSVIAIPDGNQMTLHRGGEKQTGDLYKLYIDLFDAMIDKAILTNTFATSQQAKGGFSTSKEGSNIVEELGKQLCDYPEELFNKVFRAAVDLNIGSGQYPTFTTYEEDDAKKEFAQRDNELSDAVQKSGQRLKFNKKYFVSRYDFKDDEFEIEDNPEDTSGYKKTPPPEFAESESNSSADYLSTLESVLPDKLLQFQMEKTLEPLFELKESSTSQKEFSEGLLKLYPQLNSKEIEDLAAKVFFISEIESRAYVEPT